MKKSTIMMISILTVLFGVLLAVGDVAALDAPHNSTTFTGWRITCTKCHYSPLGATPTWLTQPTTTDNTYLNNMCTSCHSVGNLTTSRYESVKTHGAGVTGSTYGGGKWTVECRACHHPHFQSQATSNTTDPLNSLLTGTVGTLASSATATMSTMTPQSVTMTDGQYVGKFLVPNTAYPTKLYRIIANDTTKFTVAGAINLAYASNGNPFVIRYGKMVKTQVLYPSKGVNSQIKFYNSSGENSFATGTSPGTSICMVCHTETKYFKNDGTTVASGHPSVVGKNCTECHPHSSGFKYDGAGGGCTGCHGSPPVDASTLVYGSANGDDTTKQTGATSAGAHVKHAVTLNYACEKCHEGAMPATPIPDTYIQMGFQAPDNNGGTYTTRGSLVNNYSYTAGNVKTTLLNPGTAMQCSSLYCHSTGQSASGGTLSGGDYKTPTWTGTVVCGDCHAADGVNGTKTLMNTASHTKHVSTTAGTGYAIACSTCHQGAGENTTSHVNNQIEVAFDAAKAGVGSYGGNTGNTGDDTAGQGYGTCSTTYCHGNFTGGLNLNTATWGNQSSGACETCHNATNTTPPTTGAHEKHVTATGYNFGCQLCHNTVTTNGTSITTAAMHVNKAANWGMSASDSRTNGALYKSASSGTNATVGSNYGTCTNLYCHSNGTLASGPYTVNTTTFWSGSLDCAGCHNGTTSNSLVMSTGSHSAHVSENNKGCDYCHNNTTTDGSTITTKSNHANKKVDLAFNSLNSSTGKINTTWSSTAKDPGTAAVTCSTLYCHGATGAPTWGNNDTLNCASCHNASSALLGKHSLHYGSSTTAVASDRTPANNSTAGAYVFTCGVCHKNASHANGLASSPNRAADIAFDSTIAGSGSYAQGALVGADRGFNWTSGTCSTTNCHSNGKIGTGVLSSTTPTWNGTSLGCNGCHGREAGGNSSGVPAYTTGGGGLVTANSHTQHVIGSSIGCQKCHANTTTTGNSITNHINHVDGSTSTGEESKDVAFSADVATGGSYSYKPAGGNKTCSTTYCHGSASPQWGNNTQNASCTKCHGVSGTQVGQYTTNHAAPGYVSTTPTGTGRATSGSMDATNAKVGAHNAHVTGNGGYGSALACTVCHENVVTAATTSHMDGGTTFAWSALSNTAGLTPNYNFGNNTCSTTYCHGNSFPLVNQGTGTAPDWKNTSYIVNQGSSLTDCQVCHVSPPTKKHNGTDPHPTGYALGNCNGCHNHNGYGDSRHINGYLESGGDCNSCHDYDAVGSTYVGGIWSSGSWTGNSQDGLVPTQGSGAHAKHINHIKTRLSITQPLNPAGQTFGTGRPAEVCGVCHTNTGAHDMTGNTTGRLINFGDTHDPGTANGGLTSPYMFGTNEPNYNGTPGSSSSVSPKTCSNVSCHFKETPVWSAY